MSNTIAGNVAGATGVTVYLVQRHTAYSSVAGTSPQQAVTDSSGNYSFTVTSNGPYFLYTAANPVAKTKVIMNSANVANVNF